MSLNPDLTEGYTSLAGMLLQQGKSTPQRTAAQRALAIDPYDAAAYNRGRPDAGLERRKCPEALFDFEKATRLRASYGPYQYDYALMLVRLNRLDEAQAAVEASIQGGSEFLRSSRIAGRPAGEKVANDEATREYQRAVELQPDFSRAQLDLGLALAAQGDLTGAAEHLHKAAAAHDPQRCPAGNAGTAAHRATLSATAHRSVLNLCI